MAAAPKVPAFSPAGFSPERKAIVALILVVIAVYGNGLRVPFLLDDEITIGRNESIRSFWASLWPSDEVHTRGRPVLGLSFALNHRLGGMNVVGYHVANIAIHVLATLTLFGVVRRTLELPRFKPRFGGPALSLAFAGALLWSVHPVQTVCVTYISQRAESLMGLFYLGTFYCFVRAVGSPAPAWRVAALTCCALGMLVKEVMVTAPLLALLFDGLLVTGSFARTWRERRGFHLGLAATWGVLAAIMAASQLKARGVGFGLVYDWFQYLQIECYALVHYVRIILWPSPLVFDYGAEQPIPTAGTLILCASLLVLAAIGIGLSWRKRPLAAFLGCWFFLILLPTSSIVPVAGQPIAENRLYLPSAAIALGLAFTGHFLLGARARVLVFPLLAALSLGAIVRNHDYRSDLAIWRDTQLKRPQSFRANFYYANALLHAGQLEAGGTTMRRAIALRPDDVAAQLNLGSTLILQQRPAESLPYFAKALQLAPNDANVHSTAAAALFQMGRADEALAHYQEAIRLKPLQPDAYINRAIVLARVGRMAEAIAAMRDVVAKHPGYEPAQKHLALMLAAAAPAPAPPR